MFYLVSAGHDHPFYAGAEELAVSHERWAYREAFSDSERAAEHLLGGETADHPPVYRSAPGADTAGPLPASGPARPELAPQAAARDHR